MRAHRRQLLGGLAGLVALAGTLSGWHLWQDHAVREALDRAEAALAHHTWAGDEAAKAELEGALGRRPEQPEVLDHAAHLAARRAFWAPSSPEARAEAEALLSRAERLEVVPPGAVAGRALMDLLDARPGAAALRLARGLEIWPEDPRLGLAMAETELRLERPDLAQARLTALLTARPDHLPAAAALAALLKGTGSRQAALRLYRTTAERAPAFLPAQVGWLTLAGRLPTEASAAASHLVGPGAQALAEAEPESACEALGLARDLGASQEGLEAQAQALGCRDR